MKRIALTLAGYLLWNVGLSAALLLTPPAWSAPAVLLLFWLVVHWLVGSGRGGATARKRLRVRLRPPRARVWWGVALAVPLLLLAAVALGTVWGGLIRVAPESANPFLAFLDDPARRLAIALYVIGIAPLVEEIVFRGVLQGGLERRMRVGAAIPLAAVVFAGLHLLPHVLVPLAVIGAALGYVAWATRSLWPAVILHATNNTAAYTALILSDDQTVPPTVWETGVTGEWLAALAGLAACCAAAVPLGRWLRRAGRPGAAPPAPRRPVAAG